MTLTLQITNRDRLENGSPTELVLHNRGAIIGRSATCEWPLPDDGRLLSRSHCKIIYDDGAYMIEDMSVNGTFLNQKEEPISEPYRLQPGDKFTVGPFQIEARLTGEALFHHNEQASLQAAGDTQNDWDSWDDTPAAQSPTPNPATQENETWGVEAIVTEDVSHWSDKSGPEPLAPTSDEIFNTLSNNHEVDWDNTAWDVEEDFDPFAVQDLTPAAPKKDPFGSLGPTGSDALGNIDAEFDAAPQPSVPQPSNAETDSPEFWDKWQAGENPTSIGGAKPPPNRVAPAQAIPPAQGAPTAHIQGAAPAPAAPQNQEVYKKLIGGIGISSASLNESPEDTAARTGRMLRRLLAGLVTLLLARARAKDAMGASATQLRLDGNNPLKFARDIDQALAMVMNPARPGYMEIDMAIEDSYRDLQAHQIATLKAMQGALKSTLERFSPDTIKKEAAENGFLKKILPGQREAALWKAYEKQFNGSVQGSAEAFFDTFSVEFRKAYEDATRGQ